MADIVPPTISLTAEGGGFVLTCSACQWTKYNPKRGAAEADRVAHAAKCKGPKPEKATPAAQAPRSIGWDDREGATWIDQL